MAASKPLGMFLSSRMISPCRVLEMVKTLVETGADMDVPGTLYLALVNSHIESLRYMVSMGANMAALSICLQGTIWRALAIYHEAIENAPPASAL